MPEQPIRKLTESGRLAANALSAHTLRIARPLFWHIGANNGGVPFGASAFVLRFEERYVGVTADHVIDQYLEALAGDSRMICQLGTARIWPERSMIARSSKLDIATFTVDSSELLQSAADAIDCRGQWPPPEVNVGDTLTLTGFLNNHRTKQGLQHYEMLAWGGHGIADAVTDRDIVTIYEPEHMLQPDFAAKKPPLAFNMSGCSGGPVVLVKEVNDLLRWFPVGLIYKGPGEKAEGEFLTFDRIHVRRMYFVQRDGTINEPDQGWLPS